MIAARRDRYTTDADLLTFWCEHCRKRHTHGGGPPGSPEGTGNGHRDAHCREGSPFKDSGYVIVEATATIATGPSGMTPDPTGGTSARRCGGKCRPRLRAVAVARSCSPNRPKRRARVSPRTRERLSRHAAGAARHGRRLAFGVHADDAHPRAGNRKFRGAACGARKEGEFLRCRLNRNGRGSRRSK